MRSTIHLHPTTQRWLRDCPLTPYVAGYFHKNWGHVLHCYMLECKTLHPLDPSPFFTLDPEAPIDPQRLAVLPGERPRRGLNLVLDWGALHQLVSLEDWEPCSWLQTLHPIKPST